MKVVKMEKMYCEEKPIQIQQFCDPNISIWGLD